MRNDEQMVWDPLLCGLMPGGDYTDEDGEAIEGAMKQRLLTNEEASTLAAALAIGDVEDSNVHDEAVHLEVAL